MGLKPTFDGIYIGDQQKRCVEVKKLTKALFKRASKLACHARADVVVIIRHTPDIGLETSGDIGIFSSMGERLGEFLGDTMKQLGKNYVKHLTPEDYQKFSDVTRSSWLNNETTMEKEDEAYRMKRYREKFYQYAGDKEIEDYWWQGKALEDVSKKDLERLEHRTSIKVVNFPTKKSQRKSKKQDNNNSNTQEEPQDSLEIDTEAKVDKRILFKPTTADFRQFCSEEVYKTSSVYQEHKRSHDEIEAPKTEAQKLRARKFKNVSNPRKSRFYIPTVVAEKVPEITSNENEKSDNNEELVQLPEGMLNFASAEDPYFELKEFLFSTPMGDDDVIPPLEPLLPQKPKDEIEDKALSELKKALNNCIYSLSTIKIT